MNETEPCVYMTSLCFGSTAWRQHLFRVNTCINMADYIDRQETVVDNVIDVDQTWLNDATLRPLLVLSTVCTVMSSSGVCVGEASRDVTTGALLARNVIMS